MAVALSVIWDAAQAACLEWSTKKGGFIFGMKTEVRSERSGDVRSGDSWPVYSASAGKAACVSNHSDQTVQSSAVTL